jgi:glycosyltransferase involved in cell wall biosynthesis
MSEQQLSFCMVTTFYPPHHFGGDAVYVHRLSNELARRGHRVTVVYSPDAFSTLNGTVRTAPEEHPNVSVRPLGERLGAVTPLVTYLSGRPGLRARELREVLGGRFDVIHFHNVSLVGGPGVLEYGDAIKLYTTHEHWLVCPMHVLWKNNREPCERPQCLRCTLAFHRPPQLWRYSRLLERESRHVDMFLSPSRFTIAKHRERGFTRPMAHLPYFLPQQEAVEPAGAERPYFLVVGRLERLKGVQTLIELFRGYDAADLVVAGEGTYGEELRRQASGLPHVRFLGSVPFYELQALYAGATALLVPSIGYETFGIVTLEAFAQRTPAIVRDLGALPEAVTDSGGGFTYRTDAELLEAMEALRTKPELRAELGELGYRGYLDHWSEEPHLRRYFDVIAEAREARLAAPARGS